MKPSVERGRRTRGMDGGAGFASVQGRRGEGEKDGRRAKQSETSARGRKKHNL